MQKQTKTIRLNRAQLSGLLGLGCSLIAAVTARLFTSWPGIIVNLLFATGATVAMIVALVSLIRRRRAKCHYGWHCLSRSGSALPTGEAIASFATPSLLVEEAARQLQHRILFLIKALSTENRRTRRMLALHAQLLAGTIERSRVRGQLLASLPSCAEDRRLARAVQEYNRVLLMLEVVHHDLGRGLESPSTEMDLATGKLVRLLRHSTRLADYWLQKIPRSSLRKEGCMPATFYLMKGLGEKHKNGSE